MSTTDTRAAFEAWAKDEGLIQESHGIMSINSMCDVARKAFDAGIAHAEAAKATGTAGEPDAFKEAYMEWSRKTDWVQEQIATFPPDALGKHRADVMREEIERLRAVDSSEEDFYVIDRLGKLLAEVAVAVKGPEAPRHRHSYHDLPELVQKLVLEVEIFRAVEAARQPAPVVDVKPEDITIESWDRHPRGGMQVGMPLGVMLTHKPTATVICVDSNRSQHRNKALSMEGLRAILAATNRSQP